MANPLPSKFSESRLIIQSATPPRTMPNAVTTRSAKKISVHNWKATARPPMLIAVPANGQMSASVARTEVCLRRGGFAGGGFGMCGGTAEPVLIHNKRQGFSATVKTKKYYKTKKRPGGRLGRMAGALTCLPWVWRLHAPDICGDFRPGVVCIFPAVRGSGFFSNWSGTRQRLCPFECVFPAH